MVFPFCELNKILKTLPILCIVLLSSLLLWGCTGFKSTAKDSTVIIDDSTLHGSSVITGILLDARTSEPIRGANIVLASRPIGTVTDLYGQFEIIDIPQGTYTLQVFCVGYIQKEIPDLEVTTDRIIKLELHLEPRPLNNE